MHMHMRCTHCGRSLVGLRQDHEVLCERERQLAKMRAEDPPKPRRIRLSEAELLAHLDGSATRAEINREFRGAA